MIIQGKLSYSTKSLSFDTFWHDGRTTISFEQASARKDDLYCENHQILLWMCNSVQKKSADQ